MSYEVEVGRFFTVPLKRASDVDLAKPMETFIRNTFDKTDNDLINNIKQFNTLRRDATMKLLDKSPTSLTILYQYYDQLVAASRKVPFREAGGCHVTFTWKSSLEKSKSFLGGTPKVSVVDGEFERMCVLYNIAALMTQIGNESNLQTDDGLKLAAKYFQESAGIFSYIKEHIISAVGDQAMTSDLSPEMLHAFRCIMVAQSQECFYIKASGDAALNRKPDMLAKVAMQASYLYDESIKSLSEAETMSALNAVTQQCNVKKVYFECRAQYHQACAGNIAKQFGEAIARYKIAEQLLKPIVKASDLLQGVNLKDLATVVSTEREALEKDNNFIYNDIVPKASQLGSINKAAIAKPKAFDDSGKLSSKFLDLFQSLVPLEVHTALESYEIRRKELVDMQVKRLQDTNTLLNGVMSSLNLPAALEDVSGSDVPASILEKSRTVQTKGGAATIDQLLRDLPDALDRNQQILSECVRILNDEQSTDAELREKFGAKWTRKPSAELTAPLRQEANKYQTIIENAQNADGIIRGKYNNHKEGIDLLSLPEDQLKQKVPSGSPIASLKNNPVVKELKSLCEQVETVKAEREVIETELKTTVFDMTDLFTQALVRDGVLNEEAISPGELDRIYQPLIQQVNDSCDRQESLLANVQRASEQFSVLKRQGASGNTREDVLKKIAAAFDGYQELTAHLQEGSKFYSDLTELLLKLQGKCSDLVFARKTEKEELLKDLQQNIVSSQSAAPNVPSYQEADAVYSEVRKPAPARPPPPVVQPTSPTTAAPPRPAPRRSGGAPVNVAANQQQQQPTAPQPAHQQAPYGGFPAGQQPALPGQQPVPQPAHQQAPYGGFPAGQQPAPPGQQPAPQAYQQPYAGYAPPGANPYPNQPVANQPYPNQPYPHYPAQSGAYPPGPYPAYQGAYPPAPPSYPGYPNQQPGNPPQNPQQYPGYPQQGYYPYQAPPN